MPRNSDSAWSVSLYGEDFEEVSGVRRAGKMLADLLVAVVLVWLIPFVLIVLLLPVAGLLKAVSLLVERL